MYENLAGQWMGGKIIRFLGLILEVFMVGEKDA